MLRSLFALLAALVVLAGAPARADMTPSLDLLLFGSGAAAPPALSTTSAYFSPDAALSNNSTLNAGLKMASGGFPVPSANPRNSWFVYFEGAIDAVGGIQGTGTETLLTAGGSPNRTLFVNNPVYPSSGSLVLPFQFQLGLYRQGAAPQFWLGSSATNFSVSNGTGYNNGIWGWTATGTGCAVAPSGWIWVGSGTSGQIGNATILNPGKGCPPTLAYGAQYAVTPSMATGAGAQAFTASFNAGGSQVTVTALTSGSAPANTQTISFSGVSGVATLSGCAGSVPTLTCTVTPAQTAMSGLTGIAAAVNPVLLTFGVASSNGTGIAAPPGKKFCGVIVQYGDDSAVQATLTGATISGATLSWASAAGTVAVGQTIIGPGVAAGTTISAYSGGTSATLTGSQTVSSAETMTAVTSGWQAFAAVDPTGAPLPNSPVLVTTPNNVSGTNGFYYVGSTLQSSATIGDLFATIGSYGTTAGTQNMGWGGSAGDIGMVHGVFPQDSSGAPVTAELAKLCTGAVDPFAYLSARYTVKSFYKLNDIGTLADSARAGPSYYATPISSAFPIAGGPIAPGTALTVADFPPYSVFRVLNYTTRVGDVSLSGSYSPALLGAPPTAIQAKVTTAPNGGGSLVSGWTNLANSTVSGGQWSGTISGLPAGGPYFAQVRPANRASYAIPTQPFQVGLVIGWIGQSKQSVCFSGNQTGKTLAFPAGTLSPASVQSISGGPGGSDPTIAGQTVGSFGVRLMTPFSTVSTSNTYAGDCSTAMTEVLTQLSGGMPIEFVQLARAGMAVETWANASMGLTQNLTGTTTLSGALSFMSYVTTPTTAVAALDTNVVAGASFLTSSTMSYTKQSTVLAGSMRFYDGGTLIAHETPATSVVNGVVLTAINGNSWISKNCIIDNAAYGTAGANIPCTINYDLATDGSGSHTDPSMDGTCPSNLCTTGFVKIGPFSTTVSNPVVKWTNIVDQLPSAGAEQRVNSYDGWDTVGNGYKTSGWTSDILSSVPSALSAIVAAQCDANVGEFADYATGATSMTGKWGFVLGPRFNQLFPASFPATNPPLIISNSFYHDVNDAVTNTATGCRAWEADFGGVNLGVPSSHPMPGGYAYAYGADAYDQLNGGNGLVNSGGHATTGIYGGARAGRHWGIGVWKALMTTPTGTNPGKSAAVAGSGPTIASAVLGNPSSGHAYDSGCTYSTGVGSCIDITFNLNDPSATSLMTCGAGLQGNAVAGNIPTGTCTPTASGVVTGFRIGPNSTMYSGNGNVYDDGFDPEAQTFVWTSPTSNGTFTCSIVAATVVQCVRAHGTWTAPVYVAYGDELTANRYGTLAGVPGGASLTITNAGAGYTPNASATITGVGGNCGISSQIVVTTDSGGHVSAAYPKAPGSFSGILCTTFPTYTITGPGSPSVNAAVTVAQFSGSGLSSTPYLANGASDGTLAGLVLSDNSGAASTGDLASVHYQPLGTTFSGTISSKTLTITGDVTGSLQSGWAVFPLNLSSFSPAQLMAPTVSGCAYSAGNTTCNLSTTALGTIGTSTTFTAGPNTSPCSPASAGVASPGYCEPGVLAQPFGLINGYAVTN